LIALTLLVLAALKFRGLMNIQDNETEPYKKSKFSNTANLTLIISENHGCYLITQEQ
jgi:hypothetical protein